MLPAELHPVLHVANNDQRAHCGCQVRMFIRRHRLILDEVVWLEHLADVVKICADPDQKRIRADALGGSLGDRAHRHRVIVRAGARRTSS